jgi:hypothetical protein
MAGFGCSPRTPAVGGRRLFQVFEERVADRETEIPAVEGQEMPEAFL